MSVVRTYLDYNATAPLRPEARAAMVDALDFVGNPSSVHAEGRRARTVIETARAVVALLVGARPADVVFTSGASEANATVLGGGWDTIFLSGLEHDSVKANARKCGARLIDLPVKRSGEIDGAAFARLLGEDDPAIRGRALVCVQMANNETGAIQPVTKIAAVAHANSVRLHCDAVQAPGRIAVDCSKLGADFLTISAHKLGGPKGAGALVVVDGAPLPALIAGGGQERGRRAGTENVAAIAGFGAVAELAVRDLAAAERIRALRDSFEQCIADATPDVQVIGGDSARLGNTSCVALPGLTAETAVIRLDLAGIAVSAGAACSSGKVGASAALAAMGIEPAVARAAFRVSFGYASSEADVAAFMAAWKTMAVAGERAA